ncbi:adapter molecule Crk isoform X8 [Drosophila suzukii]|uniref:Adapter molecule Crk isoform X8 n=1 Tax=Drosophila suzukii TaxID=28584 RepID=A0AB40A297_DROSZ|nr:adapter molecule Crk isoform X7 [Drosophila suzukii]
MDPFDVSDRNSWYFGPMSRQEATEVLMNERERGVFLVRDSNSIAGDYVLCVRPNGYVTWGKQFLMSRYGQRLLSNTGSNKSERAEWDNYIL